jgi:hypothetical protein
MRVSEIAQLHLADVVVDLAEEIFSSSRSPAGGKKSSELARAKRVSISIW